MALLSQPSIRNCTARKRKWLRASITTILIALLIGLIVVPVLHGQSDGPTESQVKAAFVYNFAKFVSWPSEAFSGSSAPLRFCVLGASLVGPDLSRITQGKAIGGHPIQVIQGSRNLHECHLLFVSSSHNGSIAELREALHGAPVLTVGETRDFIGEGGMIGFMVEDARVRFEVNLQAAKQMRLEISSKLLSLAKRVTT